MAYLILDMNAYRYLPVKLVVKFPTVDRKERVKRLLHICAAGMDATTMHERWAFVRSLYGVEDETLRWMLEELIAASKGRTIRFFWNKVGRLKHSVSGNGLLIGYGRQIGSV